MREAHDCSWHLLSGRPVCINDRCPLHRGMRVLSASLAIAGALCRAFELGKQWQRTFDLLPGGKYQRAIRVVDVAWRPGCGRPAP